MAERENKKSLKDRAQEIIQGVVQDVVEAVESLLPSARPTLIPVRVTGHQRPRHQRSRRRR